MLHLPCCPFSLGKKVWVKGKTAPSFGLITRQIGPADLLRVVKDAGLDGFVFSGGGHG